MLWLPVVTALSICLGLWLGAWLTRTDPDQQALRKLQRVFGIVEQAYVDPVDFDSLVELTIPEILHNLDPHSVYIPADRRVAANRDLEGSFYGIGIQFQMLSDTLYIVEVINGGAAEEAGMKPGDKIVEVDGEVIAGKNKSTEDIFGMLRGPEGTEVSVKVKRHNSPGLLTFDLIRGEVPVSPIDAAYVFNDTIGYLRLGKFSDNTYSEFITAVVNLQYQGATSLILDLRGNGGGYMLPAVLIANEFLGEPDQVIVSTRGRNPGDNRTIYSDGKSMLGEMPVTVLIDEFTASSSEILAGALQDNDRALVLGRRSFGKGLVQTPFELPDSSEFRLTVQRYFTPSGRCIQKDYQAPSGSAYEMEVVERYDNGEIFSADSIRIDTADVYHTVGGRTVYGGGGIIPDVFVPSDTSGVTSYYIRVVNDGLVRDFSYEYADLNRDRLSAFDTVDQIYASLPADPVLLQSFVHYAAAKGVAPRWYYINTSAPLLVNQIKALIVRDVIGMNGYFEVVNTRDPVVNEAVRRLDAGDARIPIQQQANGQK